MKDEIIEAASRPEHTDKGENNEDILDETAIPFDTAYYYTAIKHLTCDDWSHKT